MKKLFYLLFSLFSVHLANAQEIYVATSNSFIYTLDLNNCTSTFVVDVQGTPTDIAFHPNGNLYGVFSDGKFFEINLVSGETTVLVDLPGNQNFNSLTCDGDGLFYIAGDNGILWTYDLTTDIETEIGDITYDASGDLTFYNGELYVAATNGEIVQIDLDNVSNSDAVINSTVNNIFGIVSYSEGCDDINTFANSLDGNIYFIDFENSSLEFICDAGLIIYGGASTFEFLAAAEPIVVESSDFENPTCQSNNGMIDLVAMGGTNPLEYAIDGGAFQSNGVFNNLPSGTYEIAIKDSVDCIVYDTIELIEANLPSIQNIDYVPPVCGLGSFMISVQATGGSGDLEYSVDGVNFAVGNMIEISDTGTYTIYVQDTIGCEISETIDLLPVELPSIQNVDYVPPVCGLGSFMISVQATGGSGDLEYSVDGVNFAVGNMIEISDTGTYTIYVKDAFDCETSMEVELVSPPAFVFAPFQVEATTCGENNGILTVDLNGFEGAETPYEFSIDNGANYQLDNVFMNLASGDYSLQLKDGNDCLHTAGFSIAESLVFSIEAETDSASCESANGIIRLNSQNASGEVSYALEGQSFQNEAQFNNLASGNYTITASDGANCNTNLDVNVPLKESLGLTLLGTQNSDCTMDNGSIELEGFGGTPPYTFSMDNQTFQAINLFGNLGEGIYEVFIKDADDCIAVLESIAVDVNTCKLLVPAAFSPNNDGLNDVFRLIAPFGTGATIKQFQVYNRWGKLIHKTANFPASSDGFWWDGTYKNKPQMLGVYLYYIEVEYEDSTTEVFKGNVTLLR